MAASNWPARRPLTTDTAGPGPRIVALGGGTGLPVLLGGLKEALFPHDRLASARRDRLTAIVTVADDGGSSGRLRETYRMLPPGDIRNCLLALSSGRSMLAPLFNFRFSGSQDVGGHSLGNLILSALTEIENDFCEAVEHAGRLLGICGRILPATLADVRVTAEFEDGSSVAGESKIAVRRRHIRRVRLQPAGARVLPEAARHAPKIRIDDVLLNTTPITPALLARYSAAGAVPITIDREILQALGYRPYERDLLRADHQIRHDPGKLAHAVIETVANREAK